MVANTTNLALTSLKNVYVLTTTIESSYGKEKLNWHFLVRKKDFNYYDLFTNKTITILEHSKAIIGALGEYNNHCDVRFEKITHIKKFSNRFKGMDLESFAALSEFNTYINIMSNMVNENDPQLIFEV